ncbi:MAG: bifunctional demethylmenaquinone methyltransferase/2-methoxy-6-polyprenyl-1,4-benzoquinol methylase [Acidobacteria bacterium 37-65-4]|nr:MAG: bifunctional demethylmenaquinone methyltransferase/2-methoxy-6-polyprenyl-1,4-benzoquinol methylase [Acidobacteria bacterium 37-65-4]
MFSAIASTYDFLNHVLSLNVDRRWRRIAVSALAPRQGDCILDLCTGTGDLAFALMGRSEARVVGVDFSAGMLAVARRKARERGLPLPLVQADALALPFSDECFEGAMVAFGVRNFEDLDAGLREMARVLKPGGRLAILEFSSPDRPFFGALYWFYFCRVLPRVGRLVSGADGPYSYLPATVEGFPSPQALAGKLAAQGFQLLAQRPLTGGIVTLHLVEKRMGSAGTPPSGRMTS